MSEPIVLDTSSTSTEAPLFVTPSTTAVTVTGTENVCDASSSVICPAPVSLGALSIVVAVTDKLKSVSRCWRAPPGANTSDRFASTSLIAASFGPVTV